MAPPVRTPRETWIAHGLRALGDGGPEAVRVDALARELGVTRGGFYWHFAGREQLLTALLDEWERRTTDAVIEQLDREEDDPRVRLVRAGRLTLSDELLPIDLAIRDWARRDPDVGRRLRRVDDRRMEYLRRNFARICADEREVEARSLLAFSLVIGNHFIAAGHRSRSRREAVQAAIDLLLA